MPDGQSAATISQEAFERVLQQAVIRPAGRQFRGEPARQVEILRCLREAGRPVSFDEIHQWLRHHGVVRSVRQDDPARRKAIAQAIEAINTKLGTFFFLARDPAALEEMFRVRIHAEDASRPAYSLQEFFEVRRLSGVRYYATTAERSGGLTQELLEIVRIRPRTIDMMSPSLESFFGNPEFRSMVARVLQDEPSEEGDAQRVRVLRLDPAQRVRVLLLDPDAAAAARLERIEREEAPVLGSLRDRIRATLAHAVDVVSALPKEARERFSVRVSPAAPLWRFRMIFLPEVLHLRLASPGGASETLIKLGVTSALYTSLHDVFEQQWAASDNGGSAGKTAR